MNPFLKISFILFVSLGVVFSCVKVKRSFQVTLPPSPSAAQRSQNSVFELRNAILASISNDDINSYLKLFQLEISNKEFIDTKSAEPTSKPFLGGKLETSIQKTISKFCIKNLSFSSEGPNSLSFSIIFSSCGINVELQNAVALLRPGGSLSNKPIRLAVNKFKISDPEDVRDFTLVGQFTTDESGVIHMDPNMKLVGLESLADPNSFTFQVETSSESDALKFFNKTKDEISTELVTQLLQAGHVYLENRLSDAVAKVFKKASEKINEKNLGHISKTWKFLYSDIQLNTDIRLNGFSAEKNIYVALTPKFSIVSSSPNISSFCDPPQYGVFPDADPRWLRGTKIEELFLAKSSANVSNSSANSLETGNKILLPWTTFNYILWHILGSHAKCNWSNNASSEDQNVSISLEYFGHWSMETLPDEELEKLGPPSDNQNILQLKAPKINIKISTLLSQKIIIALINQGFLTNGDISDILDIQLESFTYPVVVKKEPKVNLYRLAVRNEERYLLNSEIDAQAIINDVIEQIRLKPSFASANTNQKKSLIATALITSQLNYRLGKYFHNQNLSIMKSGVQNSVTIKTLQFTEKGILASLDIQATSQQPTLSRSISNQNSNLSPKNYSPGLSALTSEPLNATQQPSMKQVSDGLLKLGIPPILGQSNEEAKVAISRQFSNSKWQCSDVSSVVLPVNEDTSTIANYQSCADATNSVEFRYHTEKATITSSSKESKIIFVQTSIKSKIAAVHVDLETQNDLWRLLGKPKSEVLVADSFEGLWDVENMHLLISGLCTNSKTQGSCDMEHRRINSIVEWSN